MIGAIGRALKSFMYPKNPQEQCVVEVPARFKLPLSSQPSRKYPLVTPHELIWYEFNTGDDYYIHVSVEDKVYYGMVWYDRDMGCWFRDLYMAGSDDSLAYTVCNNSQDGMIVIESLIGQLIRHEWEPNAGVDDDDLDNPTDSDYEMSSQQWYGCDADDCGCR